MTILSFLKDYLIVIIYDSFISLVFALLIIYSFRIKDTTIRILFLFLPLIKPFFVIIEDINHNKYYFQERLGVMGFRFVSPNTIFNRIDLTQNSPLNKSNLDLLVLIIIISSIVLVLLTRWLNLYLFYKRLSYEEEVNQYDIPDIFNIINVFIEKIKIASPQVNLTHRHFFSPFVIGIKKSIIVLSPKLIDELTQGEKEILLQHELAHIKRKDNLISWISLILRDLLFFNPFAYIAYILIKIEQEKGCDKIILNNTHLLPKEIARHTINLIFKINNLNNKSKKPILLNPVSNYNFLQQINYIILNNRIKNILNKNPKNMNNYLKFLLFILFLFLLSVQLLLIIRINENSFIFLR